MQESPMICAWTMNHSPHADGPHCSVLLECIAERLMLTSPPRKSQASRLLLPMVHVRPASTGVLSSFRSLPAHMSPNQLSSPEPCMCCRVDNHRRDMMLWVTDKGVRFRQCLNFYTCREAMMDRGTTKGANSGIDRLLSMLVES